MPFLEAYTRQGRWSDAAGLVQKILAYDPSYASYLCGRWQAWSNGMAVRSGACR
jgi:hypothetical protein